MWGKIGVLICCFMIWGLLSGGVFIIFADDDHGRLRERTHEGHGKRDHASVKPVINPVYREECGACHFPYQPELLPSASWRKLVAGIDDHFGQSLALEDSSRSSILDYLMGNSAEKSSAKRAIRIVQSLGSDVPSRITDIPYIRKKHRRIEERVLERESIGSLSNCISCHPMAEEGIYDDDNVTIPR